VLFRSIEKDKIRIDKKKLARLKVKGKIIGELAKGKDVELQGKKVQAKDLTYKEKGKKITIILDTAINPNTYLIAKDSDLLICEATYSKKEKELAQEYKHLTAEDAAGIAKKARVKRLILTHLSQRYEKKLFPIFEEARKIFKNVSVAEDLDVLEI
jgi:ribonuclease Z